MQNSSRILLAVVFTLVNAALSACTAVSQRPDGGTFVARELLVDGRTHRYQVFVPVLTDAHGKSPVILFLHGSGERGDDGVRQTQSGLGPYVRAHADTFPAIVVFPQAAQGSEWADANLDMALAELDAATREFGGDPDRTYLTGLSMGGYGTWQLALQTRNRFAALVPICGGLSIPADRPTMRVDAVADAADPFRAAATQLRNDPIWMFHGAKDDLVLPDESRRMAAALKAAGARDARYTEFPDANHNSWDPAYATPELWTWLFAQKRR
jgi:predicted peptidase